MNTQQIESHRVTERRQYYRHLALFAAVNGALAALNLALSPQSAWFVVPLTLWGFGLAVHTLSALGEGTWLDARREYHAIMRLMDEDQRRFAAQRTRRHGILGGE
jgi:hypothetical protein